MQLILLVEKQYLSIRFILGITPVDHITFKFTHTSLFKFDCWVKFVKTECVRVEGKKLIGPFGLTTTR